MKDKKFGLSYKFFGLIASVAVLVTVALVYFAIDEYRDGMYRQLLKRSFRNLDTINTRLQNELWTKTGRLLRGGGRPTDKLAPELVYRVEKIFDDMINNDVSVRYFVLYYPAGTLVYPGVPKSKQSALQKDRRAVQEIEKYDARFNSRSSLIETFMTIPDRDDNVWAHVEMGVSPQAVQSGILRMVRNSVGIAVVSVALALWLAWHFLGNILVPVKRLKDAASAIAGGNLDQRVDITTRDEIADLGKSFNMMTDGLKHRIEDLNTVQAFSKAISAQLGREELLRTITRTFTQLSGADQSAMLTMTKDRDKFRISSGVNVVDERARIPADGLVVSRVVQSLDELVLSPPISPGPELAVFYPNVQVPSNLSAIALPVVIGSRVDSVILLCGDKVKTDVDSRRLYRALLGHAAAAIQNANLYELAITDGLTGLFLRRHFLFELDRVLSDPATDGRDKMALVMLDIDHFKKVNDSFGHPEGDFILVSIAETLKETLRVSDLRFAERAPDMVGRYGGEEFILLLRNVDRAAAELVAERIRLAVANKIFAGEKNNHKITISLGLCPYQKSISAEDWISRADRLLYASKNTGRNRVTMDEG